MVRIAESGKVWFTLLLIVFIVVAVISIGHIIFRLTQNTDISDCYLLIAEGKECVGTAELERSLWTGKIKGVTCENGYIGFTKVEHKQC